MREICSACNRQEASYHLTEVSSDGMKQVPICHLCAAARGLKLGAKDQDVLDTAEIWADIIEDLMRSKASEGTESLRCGSCGINFKKFEREMKLGCPRCYQTFRGDLCSVLQDYNGTDQHVGKIPYKIGRQLDLQQRLLHLKENLRQAVLEERFEEAARLRDEMDDLAVDITGCFGGGSP